MPAEGVMSWWECWCWPDRVANFNAKAATAEVLVGPDRLKFVEREVVFIYTDRAMLARIVASTDAVAEIRLGRDDASFFTSDEGRSEEHTSELQSLMRISYAVFCLKKKKNKINICK